MNQYRLLGQACARHPRLIERLKLLRPGLMIDRASLSDEPPLVQQLLDDILNLFLLRPGHRAVEARERAQRFQSDQASTEASRARALKTLATHHRDVVALLPDYPAKLGKAKVRRRASPEEVRSRVASFLGVFDQRSTWIIAVLLLSGGLRLANTLTTRPTSLPITPPGIQTPGSVPLPGVDISRIPVDTARMAPAITRFLSGEFKAMIRRELIRIGKPLEDRQLDAVVERLRVEDLPHVGDMQVLIREGHWTEAVRDRFIDRLKTSLKRTAPRLDPPGTRRPGTAVLPPASTSGKP